MTPIDRAKSASGTPLESTRSSSVGWLPPEAFAAVVRHTPLVTLDLILRDPSGRILLGYRRNVPARYTWFVPGGRVRKDERLVDAFARICREETSLDPATLWGPGVATGPKLIGVYEHLYPDNSLGEDGYGTHCVALAYAATVQNPPRMLPQDQHWEMRWFTVSEILSRSDVHEDTKTYFR